MCPSVTLGILVTTLSIYDVYNMVVTRVQSQPDHGLCRGFQDIDILSRARGQTRTLKLESAGASVPNAANEREARGPAKIRNTASLGLFCKKYCFHVTLKTFRWQYLRPHFFRS